LSVRAYLRDVMNADTTAFPARERLLALRGELEACAAPKWEALAAWRLLASNSLRVKGSPGRAAWDRANAALGAALGKDEAPSVALAVRFHDALEAGDTGFRTFPIFAADERYLEAEAIALELAAVDTAVASARDGLEAAFRAYVALVTVHPFANGNGRTARLLADYVLMKDAWLPLCFASHIASHVARTYGGPERTVGRSFEVFADGVANAYRAVLAT
jgi:hypothetical protein